MCLQAHEVVSWTRDTCSMVFVCYRVCLGVGCSGCDCPKVERPCCIVMRIHPSIAYLLMIMGYGARNTQGARTISHVLSM